MQAITPELEAILKAKLQAGESGFRGRIEIDFPITAGPLLEVATNGTTSSVSSWTLPTVAVTGDDVVLFALAIVRPARTINVAADWEILEQRDYGAGSASDRVAICRRIVPTAASPYADTFTVSGGTSKWGVAQLALRSAGVQPDNHDLVHSTFACVTDPSVSVSLPSAPAVGHASLAFALANGCGGPSGYTGEQRMDWGAHYAEIADITIPASFPRASVAWRVDDGSAADSSATATWLSTNIAEMTIALVEVDIDPSPSAVVTRSFRPISIEMDHSLRMTADQVTTLLSNDDGLHWPSGA